MEYNIPEKLKIHYEAVPDFDSKVIISRHAESRAYGSNLTDKMIERILYEGKRIELLDSQIQIVFGIYKMDLVRAHNGWVVKTITDTTKNNFQPGRWFA